MIGFTATATTPTLDAWRAKLRGGVAQRIATRSAKRMQLAASHAAPIDTGALSQSFAVQTPTDSDFGDRLDTVNTLRPGVVVFSSRRRFSEPALPQARGGSGIAVVTCIVEYGAYVNGGTLHQAAQPFWDSARLETEAALPADADAEWRA